MELTKGWIYECIDGYEGPPRIATEELWKAIQLDRQRVRDEAIAEVKKDHFRIGEVLEVDHQQNGWIPCVVEVRGPGKSLVYGKVRRPPKTRPLTREEKIFKIVSRLGESGIYWELMDSTINDICEKANIPTEVPE